MSRLNSFGSFSMTGNLKTHKMGDLQPKLVASKIFLTLLNITMHNLVVHFYKKSTKYALIGTSPLINLLISMCENSKMPFKNSSHGVLLSRTI